MRRLYYVAHDIATTAAVSDRLHAEGITDWNFHVLSKDAAGLYQHHIHSALPYHQRNIIRNGERWGCYGAIAGLLLSWIALSLPNLPWSPGVADIVIITLSSILLFAWWGARRGNTSESYKIAPFQQDIDDGRYLILVDVRKEDKPRIRELMSLRFPAVSFRGHDSPIVRPFKGTDRIYPRPLPGLPKTGTWQDAPNSTSDI